MVGYRCSRDENNLPYSMHAFKEKRMKQTDAFPFAAGLVHCVEHAYNPTTLEKRHQPLHLNN